MSGEASHPSLPRRDPKGTSGHLYEFCGVCGARGRRKPRTRKFTPETLAQKQARRDSFRDEDLRHQ